MNSKLLISARYRILADEFYTRLISSDKFKRESPLKLNIHWHLRPAKIFIETIKDEMPSRYNSGV